MKEQDYAGKLADLLRRDIPAGNSEEIMAELGKSGVSREELESILSISQLIEDMPVTEPSGKMDKRFYAMLEGEERKLLLGEPVGLNSHFLSRFTRSIAFRLTAGIALFLLGWYSSEWLSIVPQSQGQVRNLANEVKQLKETLVLAMMQQSSSIERIKAVNMVSESGRADDQIIESLFDLLNHDSSDNVRLLALDALSNFVSEKEVRQRLIESISAQTSPMVQLRFTELMLALNEKRAAPEFQKILDNANLNYNVRGKVKEALTVLL